MILQCMPESHLAIPFPVVMNSVVTLIEIGMNVESSVRVEFSFPNGIPMTKSNLSSFISGLGKETVLEFGKYFPYATAMHPNLYPERRIRHQVAIIPHSFPFSPRSSGQIRRKAESLGNSAPLTLALSFAKPGEREEIFVLLRIVSKHLYCPVFECRGNKAGQSPKPGAMARM